MPKMPSAWHPFSRRAGARGGGDEGGKSTEQRLKLPAAIQSRARSGGYFSKSMRFAKHKLRVFTHLIPRPHLLPWEEMGSNELMGNSFPWATNKGTSFFASWRLCVSLCPRNGVAVLLGRSPRNGVAVLLGGSPRIPRAVTPRCARLCGPGGPPHMLDRTTCWTAPRFSPTATTHTSRFKLFFTIRALFVRRFPGSSQPYLPPLLLSAN